MKTYRRTEWYGLGYLLHLDGSILPLCIPAIIVGCLVNALVHPKWKIIRLWEYDDDGSADAIAHPYTFQLVGLIFGYLTVYRINISYQRYWEGVTMVKNMHSKWADACGQVISFDRSLSAECDLTSDDFVCHIVRLFSQMSAMATMRLHIVEPGESVLFEAIGARDAHESKLKPLRGSIQTLLPMVLGS